MKTNNLITLGAICQKKFNMSDGFKVVEYLYDDSHVVVLRRTMRENETRYAVDANVSPVGPGIVQEKVEMSLFGNDEDQEYVWYGYSSGSNTLCVMPDKLRHKI